MPNRRLSTFETEKALASQIYSNSFLTLTQLQFYKIYYMKKQYFYFTFLGTDHIGYFMGYHTTGLNIQQH